MVKLKKNHTKNSKEKITIKWMRVKFEKQNERMDNFRLKD
jgi:hypothetical protein